MYHQAQTYPISQRQPSWQPFLLLSLQSFQVYPQFYPHPFCRHRRYGQNFGFQVDTGTNTNYNKTIHSSFFEATHGEDGSGGALSYKTAKDQQQGTGLQSLGQPGDNNDASISGTLRLFDPSNSTFTKQFISSCNLNEDGGVASANYIGGYINETTAITRVRFKASSGNLDSGVIKLYGVT